MAVRRRRLRWLGGALVLGLVAAGGTSYALAAGGEQPDYRTVAVTRADVEAVYATSGTVDAAQRADLAFGTGGTVAKVKVKPGQQVKAGQVLAVLDTTELDAAVTEAQARYAQAVAKLETDKEGQAATVSAASPTSVASREPSASRSGARTSSTASTPKPEPSPTVDLSGLEAQQQAVIEAQTAASAALAAARDALAAQTEACKDAFRAEPTPEPTGMEETTTDGTAEPTTEPTPDPADEACTKALAHVQDKQAAAEQAQATLASSLTALSDTLTKAIAALEQAVQEQPEPAPSQTPAAPAQTGGPRPQDQPRPQEQAPAPTQATRTATAAQLAADQAAIVQAEADLVTARQAREQATLRATRDGKVAAVDVEPGDRTDAGSTVVVIVGGKAVTVTLQVPESKVGSLRAGQRVRVSPPGSSESVEGHVRAIGLVADTASGSASYPVIVSVEDPTLPLPTGSQAQVDVVLATTQDAVTVPISAVTRNGDRATAQVWDGTTLETAQVTIGVVGTRRVQITEGLEVGQRVVLADREQAIEGASSEINQRGQFGRPPGGVRPGGGAPRSGMGR